MGRRGAGGKVCYFGVVDGGEAGITLGPFCCLTDSRRWLLGPAHGI